MHSTIGGPLRSSSATAYLTPALQSHSNLDLLYNAQVTRLLRTGNSGGLPVFLGVEFASSSSGEHRPHTPSRQSILILRLCDQ